MLNRVGWGLIAIFLLGQSWCSAQSPPVGVVNASIALEVSMKSGHIEYQVINLNGSTCIQYFEWAPGGQYRVGEPDKPPYAICDGKIVQTIDKGSWDARYITEEDAFDDYPDLTALTPGQRSLLEKIRRIHTFAVLDYLFPLTGIGGPDFASNNWHVNTVLTQYPITPVEAQPADTDIFVLRRFRPMIMPVKPSETDLQYENVVIFDAKNAMLKAKCVKFPKGQKYGDQWIWLLYRANPVTIASGETLPGVMGFLDDESAGKPALKLIPEKTRIGPVEADRFQFDRKACAYYIPWIEKDSTKSWKQLLTWTVRHTTRFLGPWCTPLLALVLCFMIAGLYISRRIKKAKRLKAHEPAEE